MSNKPKLELTWIGKDKRPQLEPRILLEDAARSHHAKQRVSENDLFDNRLIFGDNLLALKALEAEFTGKVKCVFIDPPYNTGSAFTHYDDGLEHSIWLGLMRDRLEIIRRLLSDDGSLWITIDDNEAHYLKVLCDEVFGQPGQAVRNVRDTVEDLGRIKQMLFGGFQRCLYPVQKFESGTERRLALILERDALRWFRPAKGQFQIYYKLGIEQPEYVPDFVSETGDAILMIESKAKDEMHSPEVLAKADAALRWCAHASHYCSSIGAKRWVYLLVPHDQVTEAARIVDLLRFKRAA